ncbi:MAG: hypothetical protein KDI03_17240 [Anaerolineae bacterium]|nr:hypothetical protein [Anaerolineae bacterium]
MAYNWRDDEKYPAVCQSIIESVYPVELRDFYHDLDQDPVGLTGWFMNYCRCGEPAARMYTAFYRLLLRADPANQEQPTMKPPTPANKLSAPRLAQSRKKSEVPESQVRPALEEPLEAPRQIQSTAEALFSPVPQFHINIQLHISPETSAEQIDKIFESMSRHLRNLVELKQ